MLPEAQVPKSSYNYEVFSCPTPEALQKKLKEHKDREGFYWYMIPQAQGCLLVVATANLEAIAARHKPAIYKGMKPLTENEAYAVIDKCKPPYLQTQLPTTREIVKTFITWMYERGYILAKEIPIKKEVET